MKDKAKLWCPLYEREISSGKCLDINYERLHFAKVDDLKDLVRTTGKTLRELCDICAACPNQPFPDEDVQKRLVRQ